MIGERINVTVIRRGNPSRRRGPYEINLNFCVGMYEGTPQTLTDPGDPAETWIESVVDDSGNPVSYFESEANEAIERASKALQHAKTNSCGIDPDDDQHKPF